jgi:hypothetical protein
MLFYLHNHNYRRPEEDGITYVIRALGGAMRCKIEEEDNIFSDVHRFLQLLFNEEPIDGKFVPNEGETVDEEFKIEVAEH